MSYFVSNVVGLSIGLVVGVGIIASTGQKLYVEQTKYLACCFVALVLILCGGVISTKADMLAWLIMFVGFVIGGAGAVTSLYILTVESKVTALTVIPQPEPQHEAQEPRAQYDIGSINKRINELRRDNQEDRS